MSFGTEEELEDLVAAVVTRLSGCPTGATRDALRASGHGDAEIDAAADEGRIERAAREHVFPGDEVLEVEWFYAKGWRI